MTTQGAYELLRMNRLFYPSQVKPMSDEDTAQIARVWEYQFRDWPDKAVKDAYLAAQKECVFPVSVTLRMTYSATCRVNRRAGKKP